MHIYTQQLTLLTHSWDFLFEMHKRDIENETSQDEQESIEVGHLWFFNDWRKDQIEGDYKGEDWKNEPHLQQNTSIQTYQP